MDFTEISQDTKHPVCPVFAGNEFFGSLSNKLKPNEARNQRQPSRVASPMPWLGCQDRDSDIPLLLLPCENVFRRNQLCVVAKIRGLGEGVRAERVGKSKVFTLRVFHHRESVRRLRSPGPASAVRRTPESR